MIHVEVYAVLYSLLSRHRVVLLKESEGPRFLPIWIGQNESEAIAMRLQGARPPRPLTHDLLNMVITELGAQVEYIVVTDLNQGVFRADLALRRDGARQLLDLRPSDAIALALRAEAPIYCEAAVLDEAGIVPSPDIRGRGAEPPVDGLDVFRDAFDSLDLDDLGD
ncbi:MAG: bifunctional nuclease family protein [Anaerolineae bacterium]